MNTWIRRTALALAVTISFAGNAIDAGAAPSGTVRFGEQAKLITLDPHNHTGGGIAYLRPVYEALFHRTPDARVEPLLAADYAIDGLTYTFTLRDDIDFSDGEHFDAEVAAANINRGVELGVLAALKPVEKAVATGAYTLEVTLKRPAPSFLFDLTGTAGMMISPKALDDPALDRKAVGSGPYVYNDAESREGEVRVYTPNPNYREPEAQGLASIEIWEMPEPTARLNALKTGQIDLGKWLSNPQSVIIDRTPGLKLIKRPGGSTYHLVISDREGTVVPAFADRRVRHAMAYAIDREAFAQAVQFGLSVPAFQPVDSGHWAYNAELEGRFAYDPDKARALMAEAGYGDGFEFTMPSIPIFASRLEAVAGFLKDIGITMNIETVEPGTLARRSRTTDFPATNLVWRHLADPSLLETYYMGESAVFNPFKVAPSEKMAGLLAEGLKSNKAKERAGAYRQVFDVLADEAFLIYISATPVLIGASEALAGNPTVEFRAGETSPYWRGLRLDN